MQTALKRDLAALTDREFDLVVVGGGIFGVCAAWDAVLRGLSVALIERGDFAAAASANCFKMVHGGLRYLQHGDLIRLRESAAERSIFLRIAPHLVRPLPIAVPTYGHGKNGKELLRVALGVYDVLTADRNRELTDPLRRVPAGSTLSRDEALREFPGLDREGLTGAAVFHDGQMYSPARLALSFLRSAAGAGVCAANYVEATDLLRSGDRVIGVKARDRLGGEDFEVRGRVVVNAAGAWAERLLATAGGLSLNPPSTFSRDAYFIVPRPWSSTKALGITGKTRDPDALLSREARHLFVVPWRQHTLVGVWHVVYRDDPDAVTVSTTDLQGFVDEINWAYPSLELTLNDVSMWNAGLVLFGENAPGAVHLSYGKRSRIIDHRTTHGLEGLVSLIGVRYTTARLEAHRAVDVAGRKLGRRIPASQTHNTPVFGGRIGDFGRFETEYLSRHAGALGETTVKQLVRNYGSECPRVLRYADENPQWGQRVAATHVLAAEIIHAAREEMAQTLADVVFRRTDLGTGDHPGPQALAECARLLGAERGWDESQMAKQVQEVEGLFRRLRGDTISPARGPADSLGAEGVRA